MKKRPYICTCCTSEAGADSAEETLKSEEIEVGGGRVAPEPEVHPGFIRLAPDNPWHVCRSVEHGGKLYWMHEQTRETTWRQPLPRLAALPTWDSIDASMRDMCHVVLDPIFFGAPPHPTDPKARTGICGISPGERPLQATCTTLSVEHCLYPPAFLQAVGVRRYVLCEDLKYNGQRRRDVPDLASGSLYIDVGDRAPRRKRHSFHHELWHMVDFHLLGNAFEAHDEEWSRHNPAGFKYGSGGKHMRTDSNSSQLNSSPSPEFLNRYSTSSIAEDKAEIWAVLMCYQHVLQRSPSLLGKAKLLKARAQRICPEMDARWWERVVAAQQQIVDYWEVHYADHNRGKPYWHNWVTDEKTWKKPPEAACLA